MHPLNLETSSIPVTVTTGCAYCSIARYIIRYSEDKAYESMINVPLRLFAFTRELVGDVSTFQYVTVAREDGVFGSKTYNPYYAFGVPIKILVPLL